MIPSFASRQLQRGVADFLETEIATSTPHFHGVLDEFLSREGTLFKGPYLSLGLPFRTSEIEGEYSPEVPLGLTPYRHQHQAFERLSASHYESTLVATGTGSGKTEAFLWPILDHLRRHKSEPGIKAILVYPMNALADDQAGRLKEALGSIPALDDVVAGLYVGDRNETGRVWARS